uniref:Uncharacterized protein n=1 Tax=Rhizophora mucronata TaxID=61149 RepID=A0A2P2QDU4_RHIMU
MHLQPLPSCIPLIKEL